jgi:hypothetical protein
METAPGINFKAPRPQQIAAIMSNYDCYFTILRSLAVPLTVVLFFANAVTDCFKALSVVSYHFLLFSPTILSRLTICAISCLCFGRGKNQQAIPLRTVDRVMKLSNIDGSRERVAKQSVYGVQFNFGFCKLCFLPRLLGEWQVNRANEMMGGGGWGAL